MKENKVIPENLVREIWKIYLYINQYRGVSQRSKHTSVIGLGSGL